MFLSRKIVIRVMQDDIKGTLPVPLTQDSD